MTKRPKPDVPIAAEPWFVDLISRAHIAACARHDAGASVAMATQIEAETWTTLAGYCARTSLR